MTTFRRALAGLALIALTPLSASTASAQSDPRALEIAAASLEAMGGTEAFEATRLMRFDWAVERDGEVVGLYHHSWDRWTGDYLLTGRTREGQELEVRFNVHTRDGEAWIDGRPLAGDEAAEQLENAYGRFINDSYWILMPWKWLDPGVTLSWEGERELDGRAFDVVQLRFDAGVGLTSNDRYFAWVNRDTGLMERWEYLLQDEEGAAGEGEPTAWQWTDWQTTDSGMRVATVKRRVGGEGDIRITCPSVDFRADVSSEELAAIFGRSATDGE